MERGAAVAFVKLDCGILRSTLWIDREVRDVFITALLMAIPWELRKPMQAIQVRTLEPLGFTVPAGWYGMVEGAGVGIARETGVDLEVGMVALEQLAAPDLQSRSDDHEGRRLVRVDGGFVVLNYMKYREKDASAAERAKRYRERKAGRLAAAELESLQVDHAVLAGSRRGTLDD